MEPYSSEFRGAVLAACDANEGTRDIAVRFKVSESWVRQIKQRRRETGQVAPKTAAPRQPKWQAWADWLVAKLTARPDMYLRELQEDLKQERGDDVCLMTICNACRALEQSRKKRLRLPASKTVPTSPKSGRSGAPRKSKSIPPKSFLSTKRGPKRT
jgi:transposase